MADTRISSLVLLDSANGIETLPIPSNNMDSADQIIINDISDINAPTPSGTVVTKRGKLGDVLRLINSNAEDLPPTGGPGGEGGTQITGDLVVEGGVEVGPGGITDGTCTIPTICEIITETELETRLEELLGLDPITGEVAALMCLRDSAPTNSGFDCGVKILGETTIDSDLYVRGIYYGNGFGLTDIQFALQSDSAARAAFALFALNAGHADSADSADRSTISIRSYQTDQIKTIINGGTNTLYPTLVSVTPGVDSVRTDPELTFDASTNTLNATRFAGDGSLLTNITASATSSATTKETDATQTAIDQSHHIMFRLNATGFDSVHTDADLMFNPTSQRIFSTDGLDDTLFLYGGAKFAHQTVSTSASGVVYPMMKSSLTGRDSVNTSTDLSFDATTGTLNAALFAGDGSSITQVDAVTATTATNVDVVNNSSTAGVFYPNFTSASTGGVAVSADVQLQYQPSINRLQIAADNGKIAIGADSDFSITFSGLQYSFNVTNNATTDYVFADAGNVFFPTSENDPTLYLRRGDTYRFDLDASGHPFEIRVSNGGAAYTTGVVDAQTNGVGQVIFSVPMSAPSTLYYQCTNHAAMGNTINIV
ncbi:hypothetical protein OAA26_00050 [bacterium]|nr:hypothetical protein [bacterium]